MLYDNPTETRALLVAALERGELVSLLADVGAGLVKPTELADAMDERDRRRPWWQRFAAWLAR